ncbi:MAG TPA: hypothetical protein VGW37_18875, partial [Terriglobia bacterium]|nr:hypothetical protein [Terriglobia bacterium]
MLNPVEKIRLFFAYPVYMFQAPAGTHDYVAARCARKTFLLPWRRCLRHGSSRVARSAEKIGVICPMMSSVV